MVENRREGAGFSARWLPRTPRSLTQHGEADDADVAAAAVGQVVDQALVRPRVRQLRVVDEDGGAGAGHGGHEAHAAAQVVGQAEHLAALVDDHLQGHMTRRAEVTHTDRVTS